MTRSTAPIAVLIAVGLVSLGGTMILPAGTTEVRTDSTTIGQPAVEVTTVDHQLYGVAIALLVIAVAAFAGAAALTVIRARNRRRANG
jgi:hypothetical protein